MNDVNILIIGAGVVGLAIASELSKTYSGIVVVERHGKFGQETSSRSSEVIHAGIYYEPGSLKSRLCFRGNELLYKICEDHSIPYNNSGKLLIAKEEKSIHKLDNLYRKAIGNRAKNCRMVDEAEIRQIEPNVKAAKAIYFPTSGYVDSEKLMSFFESDSIHHGAIYLYNHEAVSIKKHHAGYVVKVRTARNDVYEITTSVLINSAGLYSDKVSEMVGIDSAAQGYRINYHKGIYFRAVRQLEKYPKLLIYPVPPDVGSVGIHTTPDMNGGMRLGPHFFWSDSIDYSVDDSLHQFFFEDVRSYLPFIEYDDLQPDMSGIMSSIQTPDDKIIRDFVIADESAKGFPGLINLIGIESPGLTASPAIAEYVAELIKKYF
ncbi:MAG: FAD-dependent oxidoreductase [Deltaproteobacteria bacterium HGW-Deltaproteobacteria-6]|jgi:L-2-hydroxyglutarate oxidase LhgO|nr:MAG: FAD-dependent oxidoreductase [Deltaproteobacteria bacterium HGW-Deltaproteobacteria-6]